MRRDPHRRLAGRDHVVEFVHRQVVALQAGEESAAAAILSGWMPPAGVRMALSPLAALAEALRQAGLVLPDRPASPLPSGMPPLTACPDPGLGLLH